MSFFSYLQNLDREKLKLRLYSTTRDDVERALISPVGSLDSLLALLSPAAEDFLEEMAQRSKALTRQRFGANVGMYLPLYLSNLCANECDYCGFSMSNKLKRETLSLKGIDAEMAVIKKSGYDSILLVSGEHETKVGIDYFKTVLPRVKQNFSYLAMEVQPLKESEYSDLVGLGLDAVMIYQETYNPNTYAKHHTRGKKRDFGYRLGTPERVARAGVDKIGIGVLLGLDDWRLDALLLGHHLSYLESRFWRSRYSVSLPRLRPCTGGITPKVELTDKGLVQLICAFRLFNQQLEISLSTRESAQLRDNLFELGITNISAGSSTQPGGYVKPDTQLNQFDISDERSAQEVGAAIKAKGLNPVWKDWESAWVPTHSA
ncbi:thiazole biosynthesis protein ThiH [Shewanella sediminis HAW-EB3]|uniref:Thiazole biosynthesis protein ThiH n=1 Tax=Shewanella sediminis (strain HAW-EB3) TaxID=425104 RepID=A8FUV4_SHESH|nr:2-iminoacetate synthase ThiH [Shewanella sediminis]ABV36627.1 thiazole biosynthesis protein ThiH [Shewanella sediminis HAW-EB3]